MNRTALAATLLMVLLYACSHTHEMLWWDMMESHQQFTRVTKLVEEERADQKLAADSVLILSDSTIAYIERLEATLFAAVDHEDTRNQRSYEPDVDAYYDYRATTEVLIGDEPARPKQGPNSAYALRLRMEEHKRLLEQVAAMRKGELDVYLCTDENVKDYSGTLNWWGTASFYHVPLASAIERLTRMKIAVRQMEYTVLLRRRTDQNLGLPDSLSGQRL